MLHGYAQTGDTFRRKVRRLEASLRKLTEEAEFVYLDGPIKLETHDIPGSTGALKLRGLGLAGYTIPTSAQAIQSSLAICTSETAQPIDGAFQT